QEIAPGADQLPEMCRVPAWHLVEGIEQQVHGPLSKHSLQVEESRVALHDYVAPSSFEPGERRFVAVVVAKRKEPAEAGAGRCSRNETRICAFEIKPAEQRTLACARRPQQNECFLVGVLVEDVRKRGVR